MQRVILSGAKNLSDGSEIPGFTRNGMGKPGKYLRARARGPGRDRLKRAVSIEADSSRGGVDTGRLAAT